MLYVSLDPAIDKMGICILEKQADIIEIKKLELFSFINQETKEKIKDLNVEKQIKKKTKKTKIIKKSGINTMNQYQICPMIIEGMNKWVEMNKDLLSNHNEISIIIENQPQLRKLMDCVESFLIYFWSDYGIRNNIKVEIISVKPYNKIKFYTGPKIECNLKSKYSRNKFESIQVANYIIHNGHSMNISFSDDSIWKYFVAQKFKADISDAMNQAINFLKR